MLFSSPTFLFLFLPAVFLLNLLFRRGTKWGNALLIAASLLFYAWGEPLHVLLLVAVSAAYYALALFIERYPNRKKLFAALAAAAGVGILAFFKYADFLIASFNGLLGLSIAKTGVALPIGISFFTFEAMSYAFDVYRGQTRAARNYFDVLLYV